MNKQSSPKLKISKESVKALKVRTSIRGGPSVYGYCTQGCYQVTANGC